MPLLDALTEREFEIIRLLVDGLSNQEIAEQLYLTHRYRQMVQPADLQQTGGEHAGAGGQADL